MNLSYKEQLADREWLKKKNEILERDNYTCQKCGATSHLNVHHKYYNESKLAWEYPNDALITLCEDCHENEHHIVAQPIVGKFFCLDHSDFTQDMLCYNIDNKNKLVYLFGVDNGAFGSACIEIMTFESFLKKCYNSSLFKGNCDDWYDYNGCNFCLALEELERGRAYISGTKLYYECDIISYAYRKVNAIIKGNEELSSKIDYINELESYR